MSEPVGPDPRFGGRAGESSAGVGRPRMRAAFIAATLFFTLSPLASLLAHPPAPKAVALLLVGWAIFGGVLVVLFGPGGFSRPGGGPWLAAAAVAIATIATTVEVAYGTSEGAALFFYAGVTAARLAPERRALVGITLVALAATASIGYAESDPGGGLGVGVTVGMISLATFTLSALGRANRELVAARRELADLAVVEERSRIARDLHDTLGHSLALITLKSELAGRLVATDPARTAAEIADVEQAARDALASVRETVSGYRRPSLATELAGARAALAAAGIAGEVEPAASAVPDDIGSVLAWAVREGVTNVLRHSDAGRARVRVIEIGESWAVEVTDDGRGATAGGRPAGPMAARPLRSRAPASPGSANARPSSAAPSRRDRSTSAASGSS